VNAKEFSMIAASLGRIAEQMNPTDRDEYAQIRRLVVYHLRAAAMKTREIAEAMATKEGIPS